MCGAGEYVAFERIPGVYRMGVPTVVSALAVRDCADYCRNDTEPSSGGERVCQGEAQFFERSHTYTPRL
jgi:hypothetical protein